MNEAAGARADLPCLARAAADRHGMLLGARVVLAMVSGGADSTALLRLLAAGELAEGAALSVLHVDHMLRGEQSGADAEFVRDLCAELGVECRVVRYDVAAWAEEAGLNLEDAGRRVRYRFADEELDAACERAGAPLHAGRIAVAHTRDDQVETFLMRLLTGSGSAGLTAIPPVRGRVVRPLIGARREDVTAYLTSLGQAWREDVTNEDTARLRARLRHAVIPVLESVNPRFGEAVERSVAMLADEHELLAEMAEGFAREFVSGEPGRCVFERAYMMTLTRPIARRVVRGAIVQAFPEASRIEFEHVEALVDAMGETAFARDLPGGLRARTEYDRLVVARGDESLGPLAPALLEVPGRIALGQAGVLSAQWAEPGDVSSEDSIALIDADAVTGPLVVDGPRPGDRLRPLGMTGTKKLSDLFVDEKVPRRLRAITPVVRDGDRVVWVAGVRMSNEYKVGPGTRRALRLELTREE
jgi:tRNA(Ile)-lysidine synthase